MMTSISGDRGVGKTAFLAKRVYEHFLAGDLCITNFSHVYSHIDCSKSKASTVVKIIKQLGIFKERGYEPADLLPNLRHSGIYFAIDEGHLYFPSKAGGAKGEDFFVIKFLAQARKQDVWIEYSTQHPSKIGKDWRRYTEDYIRLRPVIPWKKWISVPHYRGKNALPIFQREMRIRIPWIWEELHHLDADSTDFNYNMKYEEGQPVGLAPSSTLIARKRYWQKPFYFKLYNSRQMLSLDYNKEKELEEGEVEFDELFKIALVQHTMRPENFPTFKKWLHMKRNDDVLPDRLRLRDVKLPELDPSFSTNSILQPEKFLDDMTWLNKRKGRTISMFSKIFPPTHPIQKA